LAIRSETELYSPIKEFLERLGYEVKGEVRHCDLVAIRSPEEPIVVELKKTFNLPLLIQGIDRQRHTDRVYLGVELPSTGRAPHGLHWSDLVKLCRLLGLGLITVRFYKRKKPKVEVLCEPGTYQPNKNRKQRLLLLEEFRERSGDYNIGGSSQRKVVTAYREKALAIAYRIHQYGPNSPRKLRELTAFSKTAQLLQRNVYGWFNRIERGRYGLTAEGEQALSEYRHVLEVQFSDDKQHNQTSQIAEE
jgi:hypothetical protein